MLFDDLFNYSRGLDYIGSLEEEVSVNSNQDMWAGEVVYSHVYRHVANSKTNAET